MKRSLLTAAVLLLSLSLFAQTSGGPDAYGYTWKNSSHTVQPPSYSWFDITTIGTLVTGLGDDNFVGPFSSNGFQFYWYPTPQFWIGSNGYIAFGPTQLASQFPTSIPIPGGPNNFIAGYAADLNFAGSSNPGSCYLYTNPDTICVSFINVPFYFNGNPQYSGSVTFQMILNKADYSITFNYQSISLGSVTALDNIIGIENNSGNLGLGVMYDSSPANMSTIKFYYPDTVTYAVTDGGVDWVGNEKNGGAFISVGKAHTLTANYRNFGNQTLGSFTVRDTVTNVWNVPYSSGQSTVSGLSAGADTTITFTNVFTPPSGGTFKFNTSLSGITGDLVPSNNRATQELVAIDTTLNFMILDYSDGVADGTGLGWTGGNGGIGIYIEPPSYPVRITGSRFMITANAASPVGFYAMIYDDDGPGGAPGSLLDSVYVPPTSVILNQYTNVSPADTNIVITSGGVYLRWEMGGADINLGRDATAPYSMQTYEVLAGIWSDYRDKYTEDFLLGLVVEYAGPHAEFQTDLSQDPMVSFTDLSTDNPTSWFWDFDDGSTDTVQNPTHTFNGIASYNVCLTVTNSIGSNTKCKNISIANGPPLSDFTYILTSLPTVSFIDQSVGQPTSWLWDFDDTGDDTTNAQHPVYTFKTNGPHNVCLTSTNSYGTGSTKCKSITVTGVGIDEQTDPVAVSISPNPFDDEAIIRIPGMEAGTNLEFNCYDALGRIVSPVYIVGDDHVVVKGDKLPSGVYYFTLVNNGQLISEGKLVKR